MPITSQLCFTTGPAIEVHFTLNEGLIQSISLLLSSTPGLKLTINADQKLPAVEKQIEQWLSNYVHKKPITSPLPLNWQLVPSFTQRVLEKLHQIPFGQLLTYKEVAQQIQQPQASRAVGGACGRNPFPFVIPCHRVVSSQHTLCGFSGGLEIKKRLLSFEGIELKR